MKIIDSLDNANTHIVGVTGPERDRRVMRFVQAGGRLFLPVEDGQEFGVMLANQAPHMVAYPAYLGQDGQRVRNIYPEQRDDPNDLPANGGMSEAGERYSRYDYVAIDSIKHPGNQQQKFVAASAEDGGFDGLGANELMIYRRTRPGVTINQVLGSASGTRSASAGPVIGAAEMTEDGRQLTGLDYQRDATDPIAHVTIVSPDQAAGMLTQAGLEVPTRWDYGRY